ncbi:tRNA lysidine(34) synthetase TilS [Terracidiphilus gabretensis]|uniref:tRNA lysidine(34) synthetase TilS n=1 Tax=Terracidiphilus gabretensis TaxID=1577687 RepID=UPI00071BDDEA|nr:tRNA lysidine(34) synthetase TilS [Terracidiphilus gabretensis]
MSSAQHPVLPLDTTHLTPGLRLAVGVSGGADSVALLRVLYQQSRELGLVLHIAHLHHGLRGAEADADLEFVRSLAEQLALPFHPHHVDTAAEAAARPGKPAESIEEAARRLRYRFFAELLSKESLNAIATAHTLDDQAETVLAKFLRGAWTEGLSGIHPVVQNEGKILRPILAVTRSEIEAYLRSLDQPWRTDSSNADTAYTRNRIRHELLPTLESFNPQLRRHLAHMATLARDEEAFWAAETARLAAQLTLPGRPVRGGGRANSGPGADGLALDIAALSSQPVALQRRILRHVAAQLGVAPDFPATESLRFLALTGRAGQKAELASGLRAERSHRELRLSIHPPATADEATEARQPISVPVPGVAEAPAYALRLEIRLSGSKPTNSVPPATLRPWKPGDRVTLRHSAGPKKVKEVLERLKVSGPQRAFWPVLDWQGTILWMQGVQLESHPGIEVLAIRLVPE